MAMRTLTADGHNRLAEVAQRHGVSTDAAQSMLTALINGGGTMAQFSHPEFGGSGQWMQGGMTMVSDLFNNALKFKVDSLCNDLSALLLNPPPGLWQDAAPTASWQSQAGSFGGSFASMGGGVGGGNWWPDGLGMANASGAQNDLRYAYFADTCRLAIDIAGTVAVYDTADHRISGVSQQQGNGWTLTFTSQYGTVPVSSLRVIDGGTQPAAPQHPASAPPPSPTAPVAPPAPVAAEAVPKRAPEPAPDGLAGSVWAFGPANGDPTGTLTLAADGSISGGDTRTRFWSVENGALTVYDADGRPSVRFAIPAGGNSGSVLRGLDPADPERVYLLRPPSQIRESDRPSSVRSAPPVDVTVGDWTLEDVGGNRLASLRLLPDGRIEGGRATELSWRIKDHSLIFLHGSGRPTTRFDIFQYRAGRWMLIGWPLDNDSVSLFLKQS